MPKKAKTYIALVPFQDGQYYAEGEEIECSGEQAEIWKKPTQSNPDGLIRDKTPEDDRAPEVEPEVETKPEAEK